MERIKYTCANCGWETSVIAQWKDLKPKRCMNKKCNTSFRANPDSLITKDPTLNKKAKAKSSVASSKKKENESEKKSTSRKQKTSSKTEQQQEEKQDS